MKEGDIRKLPVWAQRKIEVLENCLDNNREYFERKVSEMGGDTKTPISVKFSHDMTRNVPVDSRIEFTLNSGAKIQVYFTVNRDAIEVFKEAWLNGAISIKPGCSNVVEVS